MVAEETEVIHGVEGKSNVRREEWSDGSREIQAEKPGPDYGLEAGLNLPFQLYHTQAVACIYLRRW